MSARVLGCGIVFLLASCHSSDGSTPSGDGGPRATGSANARADFIVQYCEAITPCCTKVGSKDSDCNGDNPSVSAVVPAAFDPVAGDACLKALRANSSAPDFCAAPAFLDTNAECRSLAIRGATAVGGACHDATSGKECALSPDGQTSCVFGQGGKTICQVQVLANQGDTCDADSVDDGALPFGASLDGPVNDRGAYCDRSKGLYCKSGTCSPAAKLNEACDGTDQGCVPGLYCSNDASPICKTPDPDGTTCTGENACASGDGCNEGACGLSKFTISNLQKICGP